MSIVPSSACLCYASLHCSSSKSVGISAWGIADSEEFVCLLTPLLRLWLGKLERAEADKRDSVLIFIITILLLAADFYYLKNIAGRRLVGLRWWNEVDVQTGESHWVFESSDPATKIINATDSRFFWIALYSQPLLWVGFAVIAIFRFELIWLTLVGMYDGAGQTSSRDAKANGNSDCTQFDSYEHTSFLEM